MALWSRSKQPATPPTSNYNPATDEVSLDRCVRRLREILEEVDSIEQFLREAYKQADFRPGPDRESRLNVAVNRWRIPGFCGYKLLVEAQALMELIIVRVKTLRDLYAETGDTEKIRKLEGIQSAIEEGEPGFLETLADMEVYSSLNPYDQLMAIAERQRVRQSTA